VQLISFLTSKQGTSNGQLHTSASLCEGRIISWHWIEDRLAPRAVLLGEEKNVFSLPTVEPLFPDRSAHTLVVVNTEKKVQDKRIHV
jgi:hypothetical protein